MINLTAYDTSACKNIILKDITNDLTKAVIVDEIKKEEHSSVRSDLAFTYYIVEGGNTSSDAIKYFHHPMLFNNNTKDNNGQHVKEFAIDARSYGAWHKPSEAFIIRNTSGYEFELQRTVLNQMWYKERPETLRDISHIPAQIYVTLISECVGKRYALDPREQAIISILSGYFYCGLFTDSDHFDEAEYSKILSYVAKATRLPITQVEEYLETLDKVVIKDLSSLCETIVSATNSMALKDFNIGMLFALTTSTWFGNNAKEVLAVGLEHIPTWLVIVYNSLEEATFKRSILAKVSSRFNKNDEQFVKSYRTIVEGINPF